VRERRARTSRDARRRAYGQNLLASRALARQLVDDAGVRPDDLVLEIGAGTGLLTSELAWRAGAVLAVELDPVFAARLRRRFAAHEHVTVIEGDACRVALPREPFRVVANVPFNASTAILQRLLDPTLELLRADLVLQWEVARKRAGGPRSALSAAWAPWWTFRLGRRIPPAAFRPRPAVAAAVLVAERRRAPLLPPESFEEYGAFVRSLFDGTLVRGLDPTGWAALFGAWDSLQTRSRPT
jgi:23S rRNA (adenine-N6)-dimethyltransferase